MSPVANALTIVVGMMFIRKSVIVRWEALDVYAATAAGSSCAAFALMPSPGFMTFTNTRPMRSATVETTSK